MTNYKKAAANDVEPSRCPKCGSTNREAYHATRSFRLAVANKTPSGELYNSVTWKRTKCRDCLQTRVDRFFEYDPPKRKRKKKKSVPAPKPPRPKELDEPWTRGLQKPKPEEPKPVDSVEEQPEPKKEEAKAPEPPKPVDLESAPDIVGDSL